MVERFWVEKFQREGGVEQLVDCPRQVFGGRDRGQELRRAGRGLREARRVRGTKLRADGTESGWGMRLEGFWVAHPGGLAEIGTMQRWPEEVAYGRHGRNGTRNRVAFVRSGGQAFARELSTNTVTRPTFKKKLSKPSSPKPSSSAPSG